MINFGDNARLEFYYGINVIDSNLDDWKYKSFDKDEDIDDILTVVWEILDYVLRENVFENLTDEFKGSRD